MAAESCEQKTGQEGRGIMGKTDPALSVVVTTYRQPVTLGWVLMALARQNRTPAHVIVADDGSPDETLASLRAAAPRLPFALTHVWQPNEGFRAARSRNNAIALTQTPAVGFLDQDMLPPAHWSEALRQRLAPRTVCLGGWLNLNKTEAAGLNDEAVTTGAFERWCDNAAWTGLGQRHWHACFYAALRRLRIGIKAKPRLRSGNFMAWRDDLLTVNGFDEAFVGWGQEDDDLGRRLYRAGARPVSCHRQAPVFHIPHPLRRDAAWSQGVNTGYFSRQNVPTHCAVGLDSRPLADVRVTTLS